MIISIISSIILKSMSKVTVFHDTSIIPSIILKLIDKMTAFHDTLHYFA